MGESTWVFAGRHGVHLEDLLRIMKLFGRHHRVLLLTPGFARIHAMALIEELKLRLTWDGMNFMMNAAECLLNLLSSRFGARATDPRDQLYGLLSFVTYFTREKLPAELSPNYRLPFEHIYWHYAAYLLQNGGDLGLLVTERRQLEGVPSWVPDFRTLTTAKHVKREHAISVSSDKRVLYLKGIRMANICDTVCEWYDPRLSPTTGCIHPDLHHRIRYVEGRIFKIAVQIRGISLEEVLSNFFWKASRLFNGGGADGTLRAYTNLKGYSGSHGAWLPKRAGEKTTDAFGKEFAIADEIRRSLALLDDGTILSIRRTGVEVMPNDLVCVFTGATSPIIIRPSGLDCGFVLLSYAEVLSGTFFRQPFDGDFWSDRNTEEFRLI